MSPWWKAAWISYAIVVVLLWCVAALLFGCNSVTAIEWSDERDLAGNAYPKACVDTWPDLKVDLIPVSHAAMQAMNTTPIAGMELRGRWRPPTPGSWATDGTIYVDGDLEGYKFVDAVNHEICHAKMFRLTGSPVWHL